jgi:3-phenylpropionate/cinnamic acid dioxygenase small subunit
MQQYAQLCDDGRFDEWGDLFTVDARFHVMGSTQTGRPAAQAWIEEMQAPDARGRHVVSAPVINLGDDGRTAWAWTDYLFFDKAGAIASAGRYHDELVRGDDGRWRFSLREIVFQGDAPDVTGQPPGG